MADKTTFDKLLEWYSADKKQKEELILTEDDKNALIRWEFIDDMYRRHRPSIRISDLRNMTMERFGISARQYYYDQRNTALFFGTFNKLSKEYLRSVAIEQYKNLMYQAQMIGDIGAAVRARARIDKLEELEKPDVEGGEVKASVLQIILNSTASDEVQQKVINIDDLQNAPEKDFAQLISASNQLTPSVEDMEKIIKKANGDDDEQ